MKVAVTLFSIVVMSCFMNQVMGLPATTAVLSQATVTQLIQLLQGLTPAILAFLTPVLGQLLNGTITLASFTLFIVLTLVQQLLASAVTLLKGIKV